MTASQPYRQRQTQDQLAEQLGREAAHRKTLHGRMANRVLALGQVVKMEKLSYRAFQRQYGRAVGVRAPGLFVSILRRKAEGAGGKVIEFPTRPTSGRFRYLPSAGVVAVWHGP